MGNIEYGFKVCQITVSVFRMKEDLNATCVQCYVVLCIASFMSLICKRLYCVTFLRISVIVIMIVVQMRCTKCLFVDTGIRPEANFIQLNCRFRQTVAPSYVTYLQSSPPPLPYQIFFSHIICTMKANTTS